MLLNKKILVLGLIFLSIYSTVSYAQVCEVGRIKDVLRKILYMHFTGQSISLTNAEVKDLLVFYLSIDPQTLTVDCSALGASSNKPIINVIDAGDTLPDRIPACADGTKYGQCSGKKPAYCYAGTLYSKCGLCGCPTNSVCGKSGKCDNLAQNISCFKDIDCGQNTFTGDYYCSNNYIMRDHVNYSCLNSGTVDSKCISNTGAISLSYCNPSLNQACVGGQSTCETNLTTNVTPTGICMVRDSYTSVPVFSAPDLGRGYAKIAKPEVNTITGLQSACTRTDYDNLLQTYCTQNSNPVQEQVMTYDSNGNYQSLSCGAFGCDSRYCPQINLTNQTTLQNITNQTTLQAPSSIRAGWGITNDNTKKSSLYFHAINFGYADPVPSAFRVYLKKPGESAFNRVAEFRNLSAPCGTITTTGSILSTGWSIYRRCNSNDWKIDSYWLPSNGYSQGVYRFYLTAVDSSGTESASPEFEMYNLQPLTVLSPTSTQSPVAATPTFQWTVASGWTISIPQYFVSIYDDANFGEPWIVHSKWASVPSSSTTASYVYDGPALDPVKKYVVRIYGLYRAFTTTICPSCDYISMDVSTQTFWIASNQTSQINVTGVCLIRDLYTSVPRFSDPDLGTGYAKLAKPGINTISGLQNACTRQDYDALLQSYCTQNYNPIQEQVMTYNMDGTWQSLSCGAFGCNYRNCTLISTTTQCTNFSDGVCPSSCATGADYDCCTNTGKCWFSGYGCYDCNANPGFCSWTQNGICPSSCATGADYDCCTNVGYYVLLAHLPPNDPVCQYACYTSNYTMGTSPCTPCDDFNNYVSDGACPNWCSGGNDLDCCKNSGKCWFSGYGCYNCSATPGSCSSIQDGICPSNCAAGSDYDCCANIGYCWRTGQGCYSTC